MCGIAGIVGAINPSHAEDNVTKMVNKLVRRGPDCDGIETLKGAVLGHRRLAIFDLSEAGRQPMISADGLVGLVFNGAIYNFHQLRKELITRGYSFHSQTDTEVLLHGYQEWGVENLISRLKGMFAFGLWDSRTQKLFLVRDRLGEKPLVFFARDKIMVFASTVSALRAAGFVSEIDENAVLDFLQYGFVTDERSIYRGAIKVRAGSIIEWSNGTISERQYWTPPIAKGGPAPNFEEAVEETEYRFVQSVKSRLYADVPVAAMLSGGIDSGLVCWAITKLGADVTAYTVGTPGDPWDETADAVDTAQSLGIRHEIFEMSGEDNRDIDDLISAYAEPFACSSALGMLRVSRAVSDSAKVLLTGDGGDDLFLGYPEHRNFWLAQQLAERLPAAAARSWLAYRRLIPRVGTVRRAAAFLDYATLGIHAVIDSHNTLSPYNRGGLLGERLLGFQERDAPIRWSPQCGQNILADFFTYHLHTRFVGEFMTKVDGATMYHSLEARSPFLDHTLWEFASSLPFKVRLHGGSLKAILRTITSRCISKHVARRRKSYFGIPVQRWLVNRWRARVEEVFRESLLEREGWINSTTALDLIDSSSRKGWAPMQLWYIFVLESWMRHQQDEMH
jgi:asparagine synthase (glutamine-hydrolysing)